MDKQTKSYVWIFGYGSLMDSESRNRTNKYIKEENKKAYPAVLFGHTRGWFTQRTAVGYTSTNLGMIKVSAYGQLFGNPVVGVLYKVYKKDLQKFDDREINFNRKLVDKDELQILSKINPIKEDDEVYTYISKFLSENTIEKFQPTEEKPMVQSYVDMCVNGCIEMEKNFPEAKEYGFTEHFFNNTLFWSKHWVNDRIHPRRPSQYCPNANEIDRLIVTYLNIDVKTFKIE